jgi:hypothetical protein
LLDRHPIALLVEQCGWGEQENQRWIEDVVVAILLDPEPDRS